MFNIMSFIFDKRLAVSLADLPGLVEDGLPSSYHTTLPCTSRNRQTIAFDVHGHVPDGFEYLSPPLGTVIGTAHGKESQVQILAREIRLSPDACDAFLAAQPRDPVDMLDDLAWYILSKTESIAAADAGRERRKAKTARKRDFGKWVKVFSGGMDIPPDELPRLVQEFVGFTWSDVPDVGEMGFANLRMVVTEPRRQISIRADPVLNLGSEIVTDTLPTDIVLIAVRTLGMEKVNIEIDCLESQTALAQGLHEYLTHLQLGASSTRVSLESPTTERALPEERRERRDIIKKMWADGKTDGEIAQFVNVTPDRVKQERYEMGLKTKRSKKVT